jgi:lysophospholipase L1-like esterase
MTIPAFRASTSSSRGRAGIDAGRRRLLLGAPALAGALVAAASAPAQARAAQRWSATWGCAPAGPPPAASTQSFSNQTLRLVVRASVGGSRVRIRLSNERGSTDLRVGGAAIGVRVGGAVVAAGANVPLSFGGSRAITIPAGAPAVSDPVTLAVAPFADLAVSIYFPGTVQATTIHNAAYQANYVSTAGDHTATVSLPVQRSFASWPFLTEVDVDAGAPVLVVAGDSVTDGVGSTSGANRRWPDYLARRLQAELSNGRIGVVNRGISANRLLADTGSAMVAGNDLLERFDRDVLATPGVSGLALLIGINDIVYSPASAPLPAEALIAGYRQPIERAHLHGLPVMGATLPPFSGFVYYTPAREAVRQAVNAWMRSAAPFDLLADLDLALRDPGAAQRLRTGYDSGDHLHPNDAGYQALAAAVPLAPLAALLSSGV